MLFLSELLETHFCSARARACAPRLAFVPLSSSSHVEVFQLSRAPRAYSYSMKKRSENENEWGPCGNLGFRSTA